MSDPLKPSPSLLCKLVSVIVHADEAAGTNGHEFDIGALRSALTDAEVAGWIAEMTKIGMAPVKRSA
jgi:hypothetical protein